MEIQKRIVLPASEQTSVRAWRKTLPLIQAAQKKSGLSQGQIIHMAIEALLSQSA